MKVKTRPLQAFLTLTLIAMAVSPNLLAQEKALPFDLVIIHGHIIDGTGSPWSAPGHRDGKIAAIGNLSAAPRAHIRCRRQVVSVSSTSGNRK
jgi:hypothetical protein